MCKNSYKVCLNFFLHCSILFHYRYGRRRKKCRCLQIRKGYDVTNFVTTLKNTQIKIKNVAVEHFSKILLLSHKVHSILSLHTHYIRCFQTRDRSHKGLRILFFPHWQVLKKDPILHGSYIIVDFPYLLLLAEKGSWYEWFIEWSMVNENRTPVKLT